MFCPYEAAYEAEEGVRDSEIAIDAEDRAGTVRLKSPSRRMVADSNRKGIANPRCGEQAEFRLSQPP